MNKIDLIPVIVSVLLVLFILGFHLTLDFQLFAPDGQNHYDYATKFDNCGSGYANGICLMTNWLSLNEFQFWLVFFVASLLIPISLVLYTKDLWLFPVFFVFTGFFWQSMAMQVFSQILISLLLVFFVFEKKQGNRLIILGLLWFVLLLGINFHRLMFVFLVIVSIYEIICLFKSFFKEKHLLLGCGVFSNSSIKNVDLLVTGFREPMNNNSGSWFQSIFYYGYSFLFENMFIGFIIPAIYEIFKKKDFRKIYYFCFVLIGAFGSWLYTGFEIWYVTRVLLWLPLILIVSFWSWLQRQNIHTKVLFILFGILYFGFNVWYFINRVQGMGC